MGQPHVATTIANYHLDAKIRWHDEDTMPHHNSSETTRTITEPSNTTGNATRGDVPDESK